MPLPIAAASLLSHSETPLIATFAICIAKHVIGLLILLFTYCFAQTTLDSIISENARKRQAEGAECTQIQAIPVAKN